MSGVWSVMKMLKYLLLFLITTNIFAMQSSYYDLKLPRWTNKLNVITYSSLDQQLQETVDPNLETVMDRIISYLELKYANDPAARKFITDKYNNLLSLQLYFAWAKQQSDKDTYCNLIKKLNSIATSGNLSVQQLEQKVITNNIYGYSTPIEIKLEDVFKEVIANIFCLSSFVKRDDDFGQMIYMLHDSPTIWPTEQYSIVLPLNLAQLRQLLQQNIIHNNMLVYIVSDNSTTAVLKLNNNYHYYSSGGIKILNLEGLTKAIAEEYSFKSDSFMALGFLMVSLGQDGANGDEYPDHMNIFAMLHEYAQVEYYKSEVCALAKKIGCIKSAQYFTNVQLYLQKMQESIDDAIRNKNTTKVINLLKKQILDFSLNKENFNFLIMAVKIGNIDAIEFLLTNFKSNEYSREVNMQDGNGWTPLMHAVSDGNYAIVKLLLAHPAIDIHAVDNIFGSNALMIAVKNGNEKIIKELLKKGADVNSRDNSECTVLSYAIAGGQTKIVELFITASGYSYSSDWFNQSTLMEAVDSRNLQLVEVILQHMDKSNINDKDGGGRTALMHAVCSGSSLIVEKLLTKNAGIDERDLEGDTALVLAIKNEQIPIVRILLQYKANINYAYGIFKETALMYAVKFNNEELVKLLIDNPNIDIYAKNNEGNDALLLASYYGHRQIVIDILQKHTDFNVKNKYGWNALMLAASIGETQLVSMLIQKGINIDAVNDEGLTTLMLAVAADKIETIKELLDKGANAAIKSKDGKGALEMALCKKNIEVVKLLREF